MRCFGILSSFAEGVLASGMVLMVVRVTAGGSGAYTKANDLPRSTRLSKKEYAKC